MQTLEERINFLQYENDRLNAQQIKISKVISNVTESLISLVKFMKEDYVKDENNTLCL